MKQFFAHEIANSYIFIKIKYVVLSSNRRNKVVGISPMSKNRRHVVKEIVVMKDLTKYEKTERRIQIE